MGPYLRQLSTIFQTILHLDIEQICTWREGIPDDINGHTFHASPKECALKIDSAIFKKEVKPNINKYNCYLKGCSFTHRKWSKKDTKSWSNLAGHAASLENKDRSHFGLRPFAKSGKTIKGELSGRSQPAVSVRISTWM